MLTAFVLKKSKRNSKGFYNLQRTPQHVSSKKFRIRKSRLRRRKTNAH